MSMFVLFSRFFGHFESLAFSRKWEGGGGGKPYTKAVKQDIFWSVFQKYNKGTIFFFRKTLQFSLKSEDKPNSRYTSKTFSTKTMLCGKIIASWTKVPTVIIDVWMVKITIKTNEIHMDICFLQNSFRGT